MRPGGRRKRLEVSRVRKGSRRYETREGRRRRPPLGGRGVTSLPAVSRGTFKPRPGLNRVKHTTQRPTRRYGTFRKDRVGTFLSWTSPRLSLPVSRATGGRRGTGRPTDLNDHDNRMTDETSDSTTRRTDPSAHPTNHPREKNYFFLATPRSSDPLEAANRKHALEAPTLANAVWGKVRFNWRGWGNPTPSPSSTLGERERPSSTLGRPTDRVPARRGGRDTRPPRDGLSRLSRPLVYPRPTASGGLEKKIILSAASRGGR